MVEKARSSVEGTERARELAKFRSIPYPTPTETKMSDNGARKKEVEKSKEMSSTASAPLVASPPSPYGIPNPVLKGVNQTLPGFEESDKSTKWQGNFFFIQAADTQLGMMDNYGDGNIEPQYPNITWDREIELCKKTVDIMNAMEPKPKVRVSIQLCLLCTFVLSIRVRISFSSCAGTFWTPCRTSGPTSEADRRSTS